MVFAAMAHAFVILVGKVRIAQRRSCALINAAVMASASMAFAFATLVMVAVIALLSYAVPQTRNQNRFAMAMAFVTPVYVLATWGMWVGIVRRPFVVRMIVVVMVNVPTGVVFVTLVHLEWIAPS